MYFVQNSNHFSCKIELHTNWIRHFLFEHMKTEAKKLIQKSVFDLSFVSL